MQDGKAFLKVDNIHSWCWHRENGNRIPKYKLKEPLRGKLLLFSKSIIILFILWLINALLEIYHKEIIKT